MDKPVSVLDDVVERVRAGGSLDVTAVERATGATLRQTDDSNASFAFYEAGGVKSGGHMVGVELRTPVPNSGATGGALLVLDLEGPCVSRPEVEAKFGPLTLSQTPRGRSPAENAYWSRRERWGELSFGFDAGNSQCLRSVVFAATPGR